MNQHETIAAIQLNLWQQSYSSWLNSELFTSTWWISVLFLIVGYYIWWRLLDKSRIIELLLLGSLIAVMSATIDTIADNLVLWQYTVRILPLSPAFFPYHLSLAPIILIIVYQYSDTWSKYLRNTIIAGAIYSFVLVPTFVALGEVRLINWNHGYNFLTFSARAILARWILILCKQIELSYDSKSVFKYSPMPTFQPTAKPLIDTNDDKEDGSDK